MDEIIRILAQFFDKEKIPYMIAGGQAVLMYGEARFTKDIDITVAMRPESYRKILDVLPADFAVDKNNIEEFVMKAWVMPLRHKESEITADLIFGDTGFESEAIAQGRKIVKNGYETNFIAPEFLIAQKIFAGRLKDISDAESIVNIQRKKLNYGKIEQLLKKLDEELGQNDFIQLWRSIIEKNKI
ncbi:hypothetical protein F9K33_12125 [bacterium]|nr:MAG: hypothetical protein F9K33_12125 [bacterium]